MNSTPALATQQISDADLDTVSGGSCMLTDVAATVTGIASVDGPLASVVSNAAPVGVQSSMAGALSGPA